MEVAVAVATEGSHEVTRNRERTTAVERNGERAC